MALTGFGHLDTNVYEDLDADATGELVVAGTPTLYACEVDNTGNSAVSYFKIYDKATAPTDSDLPAFILPVAAGAIFSLQPNMGVGRPFALGIGIRCVTAAGTGGPTSPTEAVTAKLRTS